jgi:hypothetical protein
MWISFLWKYWQKKCIRLTSIAEPAVFDGTQTTWINWFQH